MLTDFYAWSIIVFKFNIIDFFTFDIPVIDSNSMYTISTGYNCNLFSLLVILLGYLLLLFLG